jgi:predicted dehydrogenase
VLVVSGVRHAAVYLPLLAGRTDMEVRGVCEEPDTESWMRADGRATAGAFGVPYVESLDRLHDPDIDLAVICSEPVRHARLAIQALTAGKHVIVDKPVATTVDDADRVVLASAAAPGALTVVNRLFSPAIRRARTQVDSGHVGEPRHLVVELLSDGAHFASAVERPELVADPRLAGGGELMNFMCYAVDTVRYLTGCEPVSAFAETGSLFFEPHRRFGVEDVGIVSLLLDHDVTATLTVGRIPHAPGNGSGISTVLLIGSHGHLTLDEYAPALDVWGPGVGGVPRPIADVTADDVFTPLVDDLVRAIEAGRRPFYGAPDAGAAVAAIDAAVRSAAEGRSVPVTSDGANRPG